MSLSSKKRFSLLVKFFNSPILTGTIWAPMK